MDTDDFFQAEIEAREAADSRVRPGSDLQPGDFCLRETHGIRVYSEILDAAQHLLDGRKESELDEDELAEFEDIRSSYQEPHMRYYRFTKSYSRMCPRGELGDLHMATVERKLTREEFETARKAGWV